jgi:basic membrane protein A
MLRKWHSQNLIANPWPTCLTAQVRLGDIRVMKRILCFLVFLFATQLFAACGGVSSDESTMAKVRVGIAYDTGGKGDGSFNDAAYAGLIMAQHELGAEHKELVAATNETDALREERLRLLASSGYNPVIATGFAYSAALNTVAKEFPDTTFAIIDSVVAGPNIGSLVFAAEQGSYLVGVIAASASKSGKIGFIGGMEIPLIKAFEAGYAQGARSVNANIALESAYMGTADDTNAWNVPEKAKIATEGMIAKGVDIVYAAAGASNVGMFQAIKAAGGPGKGLWAIGVDSDQYNMPSLIDFKGVILTSMMKRVDVAVFEVIKGVAVRSPIIGVQNFDLKRKGVGYATSNLAVEPYIAAAEAAAAKILSGEIKVAAE